MKTKTDYEYVDVLKEIDLQKFRKKIDTCPDCKRIVRIRTDHYHAEQLCEKCGAIIREQMTLPELPEICVTDRELEIELNTYRSKKTRPLDKTRVGGLTRYKSLIQKYDRSTEGNKKKWRNKTYKEYVGIVNTHFEMTKTQMIRVYEIIDYNGDIKELHRQATFEQIITALCILSMKKDKRRLSFDNKGMTKTQLSFITEIGLNIDKYIRIMEKCNFPLLTTHHLKEKGTTFKSNKKG